MTTTSRLGAAAVAAALSIAAPAAADAATLAPNKQCYGGLDVIGLTGTGFTPGVPLAAAADGVPLTVNPPIVADATGVARAATIARPTTLAKAVNTYTLADPTNPALNASTVVRRTRVKIKLSGVSRRSVTKPIRVKAAGLTAGSTAYAHITKRGTRGRTLRLGKLKGACKTGSYRKSFFRRGAPTGTYRVQFDAKRKYSSKTLQRVVFRVRVFRYFVRGSSASAASSAGQQLGADFGAPVFTP